MTEQEFDLAIAPADPVIVKFTASWCGPCKSLAPVLEDVAQDIGMRLVEVDVDTSPEVVSRYFVRGVPTTMVFRSGEQLASIVGAATRERLAALIAHAI